MATCRALANSRLLQSKILLALLWLGSNSDGFGLCHFPQMRSAWQDGHTDQRPYADHSIRSERFPLRMHYPKDVEAGYAAAALQEVEHSWQRLVVEIGYLAPHPDGDLGGGSEFDIYITRDLAAGVGGYAGFSGYFDETSRADAVGYLVIAADLKPHVLKFVVSHEFFHAVQMAYDWWEDIAFMEASANWATELVYPELDVYAKFLPFFQAEPFLALDFVSIKNPYQYGMLMWPMFIEERFGKRDGSLMLQMWENTVQDDMQNEPDFLDTALGISQQNGVATMRELFEEFNWWRLFVGRLQKSGKFFERHLWDENVGVFFESRLESKQLPVNQNASQALQPMSSAFIEVDQPAHRALSLTIRFDQTADFTITALSDSGELLAKLNLEGSNEAQLELPPFADHRRVIWMLSYFGEEEYDPDTSPWTTNIWKYELQ